jgi:multidrug resistance efflux pump
VADKKELTPEQQIEALKKQLADQAAEKDAQQAIIDAQEEELKAARAQGTGALPVVTHDKKQYRVLARKFIIRNVEVDAEKLKSDKELVKELVESGSGLLKEVVAETK